MKSNTSSLPGFITMQPFHAAGGTYFSTAALNYSAGAAAVIPQYKRHSLKCTPCRDGEKICVRMSEVCKAVDGSPGSEHLGIPPTPGHVRCVPAFRSWRQACR
ncbi:MAG: hypothetical protein H7Y86_13065 [Rhizobacter sp.]|nr:hypothetical protein [Ferruginibacter sp.]